LQALERIERTRIGIDVVVGVSNPHRREIESACSAMNGVSFHCQASNMAELMQEADLALGAGGTASWERCCLGLPALVIAVADNQVESMLTLSRHGVITGLGMASEVSVERIAAALTQAVAEPESLRRMSGAGMQLVDGRGTARVAQAILTGATHE
jgi:UDP-2,4-diacetamido-2,4,6-trideoxy-beta-L-altropyranose hydrolase